LLETARSKTKHEQALKHNRYESERKGVSGSRFCCHLVSDFTANREVKPLLAGLRSHFYLFTLLPSVCASFLPSNSSRTAGTWKTDVTLLTLKL